MSGPNRAHRAAWLAALCLLMAGCIKETVDGTATHFTMEWWVPLVILAGGLGIAALGFARRHQSWRGWIGIVAGIVMIVCLVPNFLTTRVTVDEQKFSATTGNWFAPYRSDFAYSDLSRVTFREEKYTRKGRQRTRLILDCQEKNGTVHSLRVDGAIEAALPKLLQQCQANGVAIIDNTAS